jgi:hypothetical protein
MRQQVRDFLNNVWGVSWWPNTTFHNDDGIISTFSPSLGGISGFMDPLFSITDLFFFSLLLNFHIWPLNFQNTFQLFFFRFDPYCFNYYFLFKIIYKIRIIFQFHPPSNFFHQSNLVLILLITIYFI